MALLQPSKELKDNNAILKKMSDVPFEEWKKSELQILLSVAQRETEEWNKLKSVALLHLPNAKD